MFFEVSCHPINSIQACNEEYILQILLIHIFSDVTTITFVFFARFDIFFPVGFWHCCLNITFKQSAEICLALEPSL